MLQDRGEPEARSTAFAMETLLNRGLRGKLSPVRLEDMEPLAWCQRWDGTINSTGRKGISEKN